MKKIFLITILLLAIIFLNPASFAETKTIIASGSFSAINIWGIEFYLDSKILYTTMIPFTQITDPSKTWAESDGRTLNSAKSDIGLLCRTNLGGPWYMKIEGAASELISVGQLKYGLWQPWNRTRNEFSDGEITGGADWHDMPTSAAVIYTAGPLELINTPYGTLLTFSFAINPSNLRPLQTYNCAIQYTMAASP